MKILIAEFLSGTDYQTKEEPIVELVDRMGDDEAVCDAARVSMAKTAYHFSVEQNNRLIRYLADHNHWSPFSHCYVKMRFSAPIFIARQLQKHQVGFAWNEVSRRYVSTNPSFWIPTAYRSKADNVKQGSSSETHENSGAFVANTVIACRKAFDLYTSMVEEGVCPEQARMVLPQSMMTEWIWSGSLYAWSRMYNLRADSHAQREVQAYAAEVGTICGKLFPVSWQELTGGTR